MNVDLSRRSFLKTAALAAIATSLPVAFYSVAKAQTPPRNPGFYRFKVGEFNLATISDGVLAAPAALFAGNATPEQLQAVLKEGFQSETLTPDCNILFINTGSHKVLIDSGSGNLNGATAGKLIENLASVQIAPTDIDTIIITHAHGDHVGGLTDPMGTLLFPNAQYYVSNTEWQFWMNPRVSLPKVKLPDEAKKGAIATAKKQLTSIQGRVTRFEMNEEIIPGITAIPTPGHTAGHVAIQITSGESTLIHTADVVHISTINLWNPSWKPVFDADPEQAAATRQSTLAKIASDRTLMFAYHFPFPGIGHITPREAGGFNWKPVNWQFES
ncbi:MAG: MBL fold metallo-hydrolase [Timaviella obliquedivisa GSE-PSE-MK23-08B]|jgi:glyoxylase-like metal-dependent hydrolase (beta-lactamase superfamily II)|nr:MBL fold metallo-hydrolase [Timaviella obliquedivisa GSE-PSE-MK23-08B]